MTDEEKAAWKHRRRIQGYHVAMAKGVRDMKRIVAAKIGAMQSMSDHDHEMEMDRIRRMGLRNAWLQGLSTGFALCVVFHVLLRNWRVLFGE